MELTQKQISFPSRKAKSARSTKINDENRIETRKTRANQKKLNSENSPYKKIDDKRILEFLENENSPLSKTSPSPRSPLTPKRENSVNVKAPSPSKRSRRALNFEDNDSLKPIAIKKASTPISLAKQDVSEYQYAKKSLHTSTPKRILGRQSEKTILSRFIKSHLQDRDPGCLYVSGAPGTGKTACTLQLLEEFVSEDSIPTIFINCIAISKAKAIYQKISEELKCPMGPNIKEMVSSIEKSLSSQGPMVIMVLDEMDNLNSKNQEVLYTIFEWPRLKNSRLILIGIANALDLTDRLLPRLHACNCKPQLLHFAPYSQHQILDILKDRLSESKNGCSPVFKPEALTFCAKKIASSTGDVRKALDTCRRAIDIVEKGVRTQQILKTTLVDGLNNGSPRKSPRKPVELSMVGLPQINAVLHDIYNSRVLSAGPSKSEDFDSTMPIQQKLLLCSLLLITKHGKAKEVTIGKLHEIHCRVCRKRNITEVDTSEFLSLCELIESRGLLNLKKNKESRLSKVTLRTDEEELLFAMKDKNILMAVLKDTSVLKP